MKIYFYKTRNVYYFNFVFSFHFYSKPPTTYRLLTFSLGEIDKVAKKMCVPYARVGYLHKHGKRGWLCNQTHPPYLMYRVLHTWWFFDIYQIKRISENSLQEPDASTLFI